MMRVPVADLIGNPGSSRRWDKQVAPADVDGLAEAVGQDNTVAGDVVLDLDLDAMVDGILARGTIEIDLDVPCSRCLTPVRLEPTIHVLEVYADPRHVHDAEIDEDLGYEIDLDAKEVDLAPMVRDLAAMEVPVRLLCKDDCAGLCVVCGQDLNEDDCGHRPDEDSDPRWAALADVQLN